MRGVALIGDKWACTDRGECGVFRSSGFVETSTIGEATNVSDRTAGKLVKTRASQHAEAE